MLDGAIARDISRGLHALAQGVASQPALQGRVHGRLVDLIDCPPQLDLAVEVTAGACADEVPLGDLIDCPPQLDLAVEVTAGEFAEEVLR